jgi:hypothetical protein
VDPQLQTLGAQLAEVMVRNSAFAIGDKIRAAKARREDQETIAELEAMVNDLVADKSELVRIANAYEDELVAQRLAKEDIEYISKNLIPLLGELMASSAQPEQAKGFQDIVQKLLSVETVTVLQLVGFNFRKAIGEPLTELVAGYIATRTPGNASDKVAVVPRAGKRHR